MLKKEVPVLDEDTTGSLTDRLASAGADLLLETVLKMKDKSIVPVQQKHNMATFAPKIRKSHGAVKMAKKPPGKLSGRSGQWIHGPAHILFFQAKKKILRVRLFDASPEESQAKKPGGNSGYFIERLACKCSGGSCFI